MTLLKLNFQLQIFDELKIRISEYSIKKIFGETLVSCLYSFFHSVTSMRGSYLGRARLARRGCPASRGSSPAASCLPRTHRTIQFNDLTARNAPYKRTSDCGERVREMHQLRPHLSVQFATTRTNLCR